MKKLTIFLFLSISLFIQNIYSYNLPGAINLGFTNILDGGPKNPLPGFYIYEYAQYYHSNKFLDNTGHLLDNISSPNYNSFALINQFIYQTKNKVFLNAYGAVDGYLPIVLSSTIEKNTLGITNNGAGFSDFDFALYLQWDAIMRKNRPLFIHRINFNASFPTGKYSPDKSINPGAGFFWIDPYWAATFYFTEKASVSWRLYYLWCATNPNTKINPGTAIHCNFSFEYEIINKWYIALVGYALQQLTNSKKNDVIIPDSKERVLAFGPGALYIHSEDFYFLSYLYFETYTKNRPEGINFIIRFIKHF